MKTKFVLFTTILVILLTAIPASAFQTSEVRLNVQRRFGFSSGSQIRGTFALDVTTSIPIVSVKYILDDKVIAEVTQPPFTHVFQTTSYEIGWHSLSATVQTADNRTLQTEIRRFEFVSAETEGQAVTGIVIPLLVVVVLITVLGSVITMSGRKKGQGQLPPGAPRDYGVLGGAICPKCHRPYPRHLWGINLVIGKLDRCEHCGKWSIAHRATAQELAQAEADELKLAQSDSAIKTEKQADQTNQLLDDSKYQDL